MYKIKMNFVFKFLVRVVCLMGCVYQSLRISELYFSYETITNVKYEMQNTLDLPGITICYDKLNQIKNQEKLKLEQISTNPEKQLAHFNGLTIGEQMSKMHMSPWLLHYCSVIDSQSRYRINCLTITSRFMSYLTLDWFCFTSFSQFNGEPEDRYVINKVEDSMEANIMITMSFYKMNLTKMNSAFLVQYHDRKHRPYDYYRKGSFVANFFQSDTSLIGYRKTVIKYKSTPKGRTCSSAQNREQCVNECKIKDFIKNRQKFPANYLADYRRIDLI